MALNGRLRHGQAWQVLGEDRSRQPMIGAAVHDPNVWSGRALQENFVELVVSGLA
jgi:hypothetical protein